MTDDSAAEDREDAADAATSPDDGVVADQRDDTEAEAGADDTEAAGTRTGDTDPGDTDPGDTDPGDVDPVDTGTSDTGERAAFGNVVDGVGDRDDAVAVAATALRHGDLVVVPTDTVYGVAADAFNPAATSAVFDAKRRQRRFPLPVLIRSPKQLMGLVTVVPETAERLMAAYWPGPLTLVVRADPNLAWELGQNDGTVAVRMPMDDITLDVIRAVGPLATTSANLSGQPAATTVELATSQLGDAVAVYVDGGRRAETQPSTIVDLTRTEPSILRSGPLPDDEVLAVARGEIESHQASAPRPRHKPVSPGGPAETTPTGEAGEAGGTAAEPELAGDTSTGPGPEDAPSTAAATAAGAAAVAATRAGDPEPSYPDDIGDRASGGADGTDATGDEPSTRTGDAVAVDHRAAAAARPAGGRRRRARPAPNSVAPDTAAPDTAAQDSAAPDTASAAPDDATSDSVAPDDVALDDAAPDTAAPDDASATDDAQSSPRRARRRARATTTADAPAAMGATDTPTNVSPPIADTGTPSGDDAEPSEPTTSPPATDDTMTLAEQRRASRRAAMPRATRDDATPPDATSEDATSDDSTSDDTGSGRDPSPHHVARDHRANR